MRDLRAYARQSAVRYALGGLFLLFVVGEGLIAWLYGPGAAVSGLLCLLGGMLPLAAIFGVLQLLDWLVKRLQQE